MSLLVKSHTIRSFTQLLKKSSLLQHRTFFISSNSQMSSSHWSISKIKAPHWSINETKAPHWWNFSRGIVNESSGAILEEPTKEPIGLFGVAATVSIGLALGAAISKFMAGFLEETELFVPSDDDDDD